MEYNSTVPGPGVCPGGGSQTEAARRFQGSRSRVSHWTTAPEGWAYRRPGPTGPRRWEWEALRPAVALRPDRPQKERARHCGLSRHGVWPALARLGLARQNPARLSGTGAQQTHGVSAVA
jgi:hypothetical protein